MEEGEPSLKISRISKLEFGKEIEQEMHGKYECHGSFSGKFFKGLPVLHQELGTLNYIIGKCDNLQVLLLIRMATPYSYYLIR